MRAGVTTRMILAALLASALSGCFLDEIDKSMALYPGSPQPANQAEQPATSAPGAAAPKQTAKAKAPPDEKSWWQNATTLGSEESKTDFVGCKLGSGVEFMTRDDCLARGGAAK